MTMLGIMRTQGGTSERITWWRPFALAALALATSVGCGGTDARTLIVDPATASDGGSAPPTGDPTAPGTIEGAPLPVNGVAACPNVDILFVIDNSGSMTDKQARLVSSIPGFAKAITSKLPAAKSVHVGVVSSSEYYSGKSACLIRKTSGPSSTNAQCLTNTPFLDAKHPAFPQQFACVARVGAGGDDDETPMNSVLGALAPENNVPNGCNAGFVREDAMLILVLITDEDDVRDSDCDDFLSLGTCGSKGTADEWYDSIVALKGGHPENVVVLSLFSLDGTTCANAPTVNLARFTRKFGASGMIGDVCAATYDPFFATSLPVVDRACVSFVPPR